MNRLETMLHTPDHIAGIIYPSFMAIVRIDKKIYVSTYSELWQAFGEFSEFIEVEDLDQLDISSDDLPLFRTMTDEELYYVVGMIELEE